MKRMLKQAKKPHYVYEGFDAETHKPIVVEFYNWEEYIDGVKQE